MIIIEQIATVAAIAEVWRGITLPQFHHIKLHYFKKFSFTFWKLINKLINKQVQLETTEK